MQSFWESTWQGAGDFIFMAPRCPPNICGESEGRPNSWSHGGNPEQSRPQRQWLEEALADVASSYSVDVSRIYGVGYSGGAIFLGYHGFDMQNIWAGIQWACGGANESEEQIYKEAPQPECKVPGRLVISMNGGVDSRTQGDIWYLKTSAKNIETILENNGHQVEFFDTMCNGHCCGDAVTTAHQWEWFKSLPPKCGAALPGCSTIASIP